MMRPAPHVRLMIHSGQGAARGGRNSSLLARQRQAVERELPSCLCDDHRESRCGQCHKQHHDQRCTESYADQTHQNADQKAKYDPVWVLQGSLDFLHSRTYATGFVSVLALTSGAPTHGDMTILYLGRGRIVQQKIGTYRQTRRPVW